MNRFVSLFKVELKQIVSVAMALIYIFASGYFVIQQEYINGEFHYYFFRSVLFEVFSDYFDVAFVNTWYASANKIIFPLSFWFITSSFFLLNSVVKKFSFNYLNALHTFRFTLIFHFYVLFSTYATEIVPGYSIMPGNLPAGDLIDWYRSFFVGTAFTFYYLFLFKIAKDLLYGEFEWFKWVIVLSPLVHVYLFPHVLHLYGFGIALIIGSILISRHKSFTQNKWIKALTTPKYGVIFISILSLFFRYKYAAFFTSTGESLLIYNADGETYYNAAKRFYEGNIEGYGFLQTPFYPLILSVFFHLFGMEPSSIFYGQALFGSFVPLIIYKVLSELKYSKAGLIAAFLVATDPLCIHYSICVSRSTPLLVSLPIIILFCVNLERNLTSLKLLLFGSLMVATFYIGPETLPILLGIGSYAVCRFIKRSTNYRERILGFASFLIGVVIMSTPLNMIYYDTHGELILLGRDSKGNHSSTFFYKKSPPLNKMIELGFNPIDEPQKSLDLFFKKPFTIIGLIFGKLIIELPGFLLDPENVYFAPIHLAMESFYGSHIQFYIYFFFVIGFIWFLRDSQIPFYFKIIVLGSILCQAIGTSIIIFGTNRFRAPIVPLNLIFAGYGIWVAVFHQFQLNFNKEIKNCSPLFFVKGSVVINKKFLLVINFILLVGLFSLSLKLKKEIPKSTYEISYWLTNKGFKRIGISSVLELNSEYVSLILNDKADYKNKINIYIPICNFLIPGKRPFLILRNSNDFLIQPIRVPRGCFEVKTEVSLKNNPEKIYIYFYSSDRGNIDLLGRKEYMIKLYDQNVSVWFFQKINLKYRFNNQELSRNYQNYSKGGLLIGKPRIE